MFNATQKVLNLKVRLGYSCLFVLTLFSLQALSQAPARKPCLDFFGSGRTSFATINVEGSNIVWRLRNNGGPGQETVYWGPDSDSPAAGYFDNDNKADVASLRFGGSPATGTFYIRPSTAPTTMAAVPWGPPPGTGTSFYGVEGDYDGDGRTDVTVVRNNGGAWRWFYLRSSNNSLGTVVWGIGNPQQDMVVPGADYNGDGRDEVTVIRLNPSGGETLFAGDSVAGTFVAVQQWGERDTDIFLFGDYVGDQRADFAVWRGGAAGTDGSWWIKENGGSRVVVARFGVPDPYNEGDFPVCGDYNGDGKEDIAVHRPSTSTFYWLNSPNFTTFSAQQSGQPGDVGAGIIRIR